MSVNKILDLSNIPSIISSSYFQNQTKKVENLPNFLDSYQYIDKYCKKTLLQNKEFLDGVSSLIKDNITIDSDGKCLILPDDECLKVEAAKIGLNVVLKKNDEVLKILQEVTDVYNENSGKFLNERIINHLHHYGAHYEVINVYFSMLCTEVYPPEKVLKYLYITCDLDMIKVLTNENLKYEDFCYIFIENNVKLYDNEVVKRADLKTLPEMYKSIRIYD